MYNVIENKIIKDGEKEISIVLHTKSIRDYLIRKQLKYYTIILKGDSKPQIQKAIEELDKHGYRVVALEYKNRHNPKVNKKKAINTAPYNRKNDSRCVASIVVAPPQPTDPLPPLPDPGGNRPIVRRRRRGRKK